MLRDPFRPIQSGGMDVRHARCRLVRVFSRRIHPQTSPRIAGPFLGTAGPSGASLVRPILRKGGTSRILLEEKRIGDLGNRPNATSPNSFIVTMPV